MGKRQMVSVDWCQSRPTRVFNLRCVLDNTKLHKFSPASGSGSDGECLKNGSECEPWI